MSHHSIHSALAADRAAEINATAEERRRTAGAREPRLRAADVAPVLTMIAGVAGLLVIAAPSL